MAQLKVNYSAPVIINMSYSASNNFYGNVKHELQF